MINKKTLLAFIAVVAIVIFVGSMVRRTDRASSTYSRDRRFAITDGIQHSLARQLFISAMIERDDPTWWISDSLRTAPNPLCDRKTPTTSCAESSYVPSECESWPICKDYVSSEKCVVYSIGIHNDWEFDHAMADYGCEVHSFDPTTNLKQVHEEHRYKNVHFHYMGLAGKANGSSASEWRPANYNSDEKFLGGEFRTLSQMMDMLGHKTIDVLKMDCEGCEWEVFADLAQHDSSVLSRVKILQTEIHVVTSLQMTDDHLPHFDTFFNEIFLKHGFRLWWLNYNLGYSWDREVHPELLHAGLNEGQCCYEMGLINTHLFREEKKQQQQQQRNHSR